VTLGQTMDLCITIMGFASAFFFGLPSLVLKSKGILSLTTAESSWSFSIKQIESMADQKANSLIAAIFLILLFGLQISKIYIRNLECILSVIDFYEILLGCVILVFLIGKYLTRYYYNYTVFLVKTERGKKYCESIFGNEGNLANIKKTINFAIDICKFSKKQSESDLEFLKRFANYIGYIIPPNSKSLQRMVELDKYKNRSNVGAFLYVEEKTKEVVYVIFEQYYIADNNTLHNLGSTIEQAKDKLRQMGKDDIIDKAIW